MSRTGGQILADQLVLHGSELAFCVPGESYLALLDGLYEHRDAFRIVNCRHEGAAANAADAYGKLTGRPGICMVTRGPGATHAAAGVHTAMQDSTPLLLLVGQVARADRGREAFQELDYERVFGPMCKWAFEIDDPARIPELLARAYTTATSGRPGPVVLALPEDMLSERAEVADAQRYRAHQPSPDPAAIAELSERLGAAQRPFVMVGGGPWDTASSERFTAWALGCGLPVGATFRRQDIVDNTCASYAGDVGIGVNPKLAARIRDCDLLIAVGTRLTEIETQGYTLPAPPVAPQPLVHVHPDPGELGRVYEPTLPILSGVAEFAAAAPVVDGARWAEWTAAARADYEEFRRHTPAPGGGVDLGEVVAHLCDSLPADAIVTNGAGNFAGWVSRFYQLAALRHPARAAERGDGLRHPGRAGRAAAAPRPDRDRLLRRRRLPDVRSGAGHRRAGGAADRRPGGQQRHLRDDPHAPGDPLPRARDRHRPAQPGLRRARARLRGARGARRGRGGVPGGVGARARGGHARADRARHRRRGADAACLALGHPRARAGRALRSALETARAVGAGELDPVAVVEEALAAIEAHRDLNAVLTVCGEEALARARGGVAGRLAGVPLLVKDLIDVAGTRTTFGSRIYADRVAETTAPCVRALEAEGAIVIAKTNLDEFAWGVGGQNVHWGDTQNPLHPGRIAGGSSAGNAAALAVGIGALALGTDTGGSVRLPAAACGVVGLKTPLGAIPTAGVYPLAASYDTVGPMARSAGDCALAWSVLSGEPVPEPRACTASGSACSSGTRASAATRPGSSIRTPSGSATSR